MSISDQTAKSTLVTPRPGRRGMTELHYAAYCNDADKVSSEIQNGASVDVRDDNGWTALHWSIDMAQAWGEPEWVVDLLLAAGASADAVDHSGTSVLTMACGRNNQLIFERLIQAGADVHVRSASGTTPLHEAAACNFIEAIRRLLELGADPNVMDNQDRTPEDLARLNEFDESVAVFEASRVIG